MPESLASGSSLHLSLLARYAPWHVLRLDTSLALPLASLDARRRRAPSLHAAAEAFRVSFPPLSPSDFRADFWQALQPSGSADARPPQVVCTGAFALPLLVPAACERWLAEIAEARLRLADSEPPNSMHEHGVDLVRLGFGPRIDALLEQLRPLLARLYHPFDGAALDSHHSYLVEYGAELDESLAWHADDSEVTLNLCLGEEFVGAELTFLGLRCRDHMQTRPLPEEVHSFEHQPGVLLLHAGLHRHRVEPIASGTRRNLIVWARSSRLRAKGTLPPAASFCPLHG